MNFTIIITLSEFSSSINFDTVKDCHHIIIFAIKKIIKLNTFKMGGFD